MEDSLFTEPTPFYNLPAESNLLGHLLTGGDLFANIAGVLIPRDFFLPRHEYIFEAMVKAGTSEIIAVNDMLAKMGRLDDAGGMGYLMHLIGDTALSTNISEYGVRSIKEASLRRQLKDFLLEQVGKVADSNPIEFVHNLAGGLNDMPMPTLSEDVKSLWQKYTMDRERQWLNPKEDNGYSWGAPELDRGMGVMRKGQFLMVFGRAKAGKSIFLQNVAYNLMMQNYHVGYFSFEMDYEEIFARFTAIDSGIDYDHARANGRSRDDYERLMASWSKLYKFPLSLHDKPCHLSDIAPIISQWKRARKGLDVVIVDYPQLIIQPSNVRESWQWNNIIGKTMKQIAHEYKIVLIGAGQLNRMGYNKRPTLPDVGESIGYAQHPDGIFAIHRELEMNSENSRAFEIITLGRRSYPSGGIVPMVQDGISMYPTEGIL